MNRFNFPKDFIIGSATAAYQIEGGRSHLDRCIWDDFAKYSGKVYNNDDGSVACDSYHRVDEDIELIKQLKLKAYRFSICLTRVIDKNGNVLEDGINYYKHLIKRLHEINVIPFVTLYHWDLPSYLQEKGGWESDETVDWYVNYCKVVFEAFKEDVKHYITLNEPFCISHLGYEYGCHAPGLTSVKSCVKVSLNLLKAHGKVVKLYKSLNYGGKIGICLNINDIRPVDDKAIDAVRRKKNSGMWWYFYPIAIGKFDEEIFEHFKQQGYIGEISKEDYEYMTTSGDFIGLNHYNPEWIDENYNHHNNSNYETNSLGWHIDPMGLYNVIKEMSSYTNKDIYVLENGYSSLNINDVTKEVEDIERVKYYDGYMQVVSRLVNEGYNVKGYFAWSLLDNYEWGCG